MEEILIPVIIFSSILLFLKMMLDYARFKHEHKAGAKTSRRGSSSNSLAVSELEDLIEGAVEHAVRPLERRIRRLERTSQNAGPEANARQVSDSVPESSPVLDEFDQSDELDESDELESPLTSRGGNVYDVGAERPRVRRH